MNTIAKSAAHHAGSNIRVLPNLLKSGNPLLSTSVKIIKRLVTRVLDVTDHVLQAQSGRNYTLMT